MTDANGPQYTGNPKADAKAAQAYAKATRPWFKKKRWIAAMVFGVFVILGAATSGGTSEDDTPAASDTSSDTSSETSSEDEATEAKDEEPAKPKMTKSQENALRSAEQYLDFAPFSKKGLIRQLSSSAGDGYPKEDARFAAENVDVDWKEQAVKAAEGYLDFQSFSRDGLIRQLTSDAGDGYTQKQAEYAVDKIGL